MGSITTKMIPRNTTIPASKTETFSTAVDNQPEVEIHVLQGEREMAADNKSLWRFKLDQIAPAPRWVPQIEVTFDIDANGVLTVKAKDKSTGKEQHITIAGSTGMDEAEVERLVKEAEAKKDEDKKKKEAIDARNMADSTSYQAQKMIDDNKDKIDESDKKELEEKIEAVKKIMENPEASKEDLETPTKELNDSMMKIWQKIHQAWATPEAWTEAKKDDDWVVDAEEADDEKKNERV